MKLKNTLDIKIKRKGLRIRSDLIGINKNLENIETIKFIVNKIGKLTLKEKDCSLLSCESLVIKNVKDLMLLDFCIRLKPKIKCKLNKALKFYVSEADEIIVNDKISITNESVKDTTWRPTMKMPVTNILKYLKIK